MIKKKHEDKEFSNKNKTLYYLEKIQNMNALSKNKSINYFW